MTGDYGRRLTERIDRRCPGASRRLSDIQTLPEEAGEAILRELLESGCLSRSMANIGAARREMRRLPPEWAAAALPKAVPLCLFREPEWQEWEFRRAAEMLQEAFPVRVAGEIRRGFEKSGGGRGHPGPWRQKRTEDVSVL